MEQTKTREDAINGRFVGSRYPNLVYFVGLALSLLAIVAVLTTRERLGDMFGSLQLNRDIEDRTTKILNSLIGAETGYREFVITLEPASLKPFHSAAEGWDASLDELQSISVNEQSLVVVLRDYESAARKTFVLMRRYLESRQNGTFVATPANADLAEIRLGLDATRKTHLGVMASIWDQLASNRATTSEVVSKLLTTVIIACLGLALGSFTQILHLLKHMAASVVQSSQSKQENEALTANLLFARNKETETQLSLALALRTASIKVFALSPDGMITWASKPALGLVGGAKLPVALAELASASTRGPMNEKVRAALAGQELASFEFCVEHLNSPMMWFMITIAPDEKLSSGAILATAVDITKIKEREESNFWLTRELMHRIGNMLTIVQAMARQSVKSTLTREDFLEKFIARLHGLSNVHNLLIGTSYVSVDLIDLTRSQIADAPNAAVSKFSISGAPFLLNPAAAQALGLALNELVMNACDHGTFLNREGSVDLSWETNPGADEKLTIRWVETGLDKVRRATDSFGLFLVNENLPRLLNGAVQTNWSAEGFQCTMEFPVKRIRAFAHMGLKSKGN